MHCKLLLDVFIHSYDMDHCLGHNYHTSSDKCSILYSTDISAVHYITLYV